MNDPVHEEIAIIVVKQLFGGLGQNFMNPALGGRCFLMLSFSSIMTSFTVEKGAMNDPVHEEMKIHLTASLPLFPPFFHICGLLLFT